jgi:hypothetical protein
MTKTPTIVTTTTPQQQFSSSSETRDTNRFNALSGAGDDDNSSRNDEFNLKKKSNEMRSNLLNRSRNLNPSKFLFCAHARIDKDEFAVGDLDQLDKLQNWNELFSKRYPQIYNRLMGEYLSKYVS